MYNKRLTELNPPLKCSQVLNQFYKKMQNIFFTSDHHFGHTNIIKFCDRPFDTVEEMNEVMIKNWNSKIKQGDNVYHLGDFALTKKKEVLSDIIDQLNGNIFLISGNHEGAAKSLPNKFQWIKDYYELKVKDEDAAGGVQRIILFHYAMRVWRHDYRGSWQLYGHSHGNLPDKEDRLAFDVGVDSHDFMPLSYEEVKVIMGEKQWVAPF